jgi:hypothetical protein
VSPGAQDQRDAMRARQLNRLRRAVESADWSTKRLLAMQRYQIELDLSFRPEPITYEDRQLVTEKGARRFDRFEQWLMRHLTDPESLYGRFRGRLTRTDADFDKVPNDHERLDRASSMEFIRLDSFRIQGLLPRDAVKLCSIMASSARAMCRVMVLWEMRKWWAISA